MSLATRCSACGIVFRVVEDQLKVAEGWVRCGRCSQVFDAVEGLFELAPQLEAAAASTQKPSAEVAAEAGLEGVPKVAAVAVAVSDADEPTPMQWADPLGSHEPQESSASRESHAPLPAHESYALHTPHTPHESPAAREAHDSLAPLETLESQAAPVDSAGADSSATPATPATPAESTEGTETAESGAAMASLSTVPLAVEATQHGGGARDVSIDDRFFKSRRGPGRSASAAHLSERDRLDFSDARFDSQLLDDESTAEQQPAMAHGDAEPLEEARAPEFVRHAERRARWQQPGVRRALGAAAVLLTMTLVVQAGHQFRDLAAAQWTWARPILTEWCAAAGCALEAPRRIDDISVESTSLAKVAGSDAFRLAVTLHNRSDMAVAVPWIDLKLSNTSGKLVVRKALGGPVFKSAAALQPGAEVVLQTLLGTRDVEVAGYTVEIFYP